MLNVVSLFFFKLFLLSECIWFLSTNVASLKTNEGAAKWSFYYQRYPFLDSDLPNVHLKRNSSIYRFLIN